VSRFESIFIWSFSAVEKSADEVSWSRGVAIAGADSSSKQVFSEWCLIEDVII
jgi:hypothetical protein